MTIEIKQINQLMLAMGRTGMKRLVLEKGDVKLELEREDLALPFDADMAAGFEENPMRQEIQNHIKTHTVAAVEEKNAPKTAQEEEREDAMSIYVTSPMVGTVYFAPSPSDPVFVNPGDRVEKNTVVCIIEAMKVMNEVKAGSAGVISAPLVENGHPVEFGTKLFRITPA